MLKVEKLDVYYGNIRALHEVSFEVNEGEIVTLIGANGAGKTTVLHTISGLVPARSGSVRFLDYDLIRLAPHKIVQLGLAQVPEGRRIFANLTVKENLEMGAYTRKDAKGIKDDYEQVFTRFPRLKERLNQMAGTLSGGEQQMLAIGRTLMSRPKLVLMDEPSMGLAPLLVSEIFDIIKEINAAGTTILLVEQNAQMALSIANRAYVLETGRVVLQGDAKTLADSEEVRKAYLGG
ncbi:MAG TPA: ABC transporter ATP-binding protein [Firmicutes bacterium]|uniref:ABC transporter ATP-binding protein n=1 Tax=Capillibacterium thermochitinicola TaxID=2699427 RepID=A0A8J6HXT6_9FIRM|nr:ABC transporter ATP-binding protein [Capillibacterium thermochitinicola]MBA2133467.1 ABC transporter ATP-binding protein [Capillibacterium thermochitinicola]HHW13252.1 ABC transporter ATP-binding protein [Bacillota bacterium]